VPETANDRLELVGRQGNGVLESRIWVGMVLALAVTLVVVLIAWLVDALR